MGIMTMGAHVPPAIQVESGGFDEVVRRHYRLVFAVAHQSLGSARDAEDAAQEAFLRAFRSRDQLEKAGSIASWLATIARNAAADVQRRRGRDEAARRALGEAAGGAAALGGAGAEGARGHAAGQARLEAAGSEGGAGATGGLARASDRPDRRAEAADERARIRRAVALLPEHEAIVVTLRFEEGLGANEIAARLHVEAGTVRVRLHRALKRLREVLDPGGGGASGGAAGGAPGEGVKGDPADRAGRGGSKS